MGKSYGTKRVRGLWLRAVGAFVGLSIGLWSMGQVPMCPGQGPLSMLWSAPSSGALSASDGSVWQPISAGLSGVGDQWWNGVNACQSSEALPRVCYMPLGGGMGVQTPAVAGTGDGDPIIYYIEPPVMTCGQTSGEIKLWVHNTEMREVTFTRDDTGESRTVQGSGTLKSATMTYNYGGNGTQMADEQVGFTVTAKELPDGPTATEHVTVTVHIPGKLQAPDPIDPIYFCEDAPNIYLGEQFHYSGSYKRNVQFMEPNPNGQGLVQRDVMVGNAKFNNVRYSEWRDPDENFIFYVSDRNDITAKSPSGDYAGSLGEPEDVLKIIASGYVEKDTKNTYIGSNRITFEPDEPIQEDYTYYAYVLDYGGNSGGMCISEPREFHIKKRSRPTLSTVGVENACDGTPLTTLCEGQSSWDLKGDKSNCQLQFNASGEGNPGAVYTLHWLYTNEAGAEYNVERTSSAVVGSNGKFSDSYKAIDISGIIPQDVTDSGLPYKVIVTDAYNCGYEGRGHQACDNCDKFYYYKGGVLQIENTPKLLPTAGSEEKSIAIVKSPEVTVTPPGMVCARGKTGTEEFDVVVKNNSDNDDVVSVKLTAPDRPAGLFVTANGTASSIASGDTKTVTFIIDNSKVPSKGETVTLEYDVWYGEASAESTGCHCVDEKGNPAKGTVQVRIIPAPKLTVSPATVCAGTDFVLQVGMENTADFIAAQTSPLHPLDFTMTWGDEGSVEISPDWIKVANSNNFGSTGNGASTNMQLRSEDGYKRNFLVKGGKIKTGSTAEVCVQLERGGGASCASSEANCVTIKSGVTPSVSGVTLAPESFCEGQPMSGFTATATLNDATNFDADEVNYYWRWKAPGVSDFSGDYMKRGRVLTQADLGAAGLGEPGSLTGSQGTAGFEVFADDGSGCNTAGENVTFTWVAGTGGVSSGTYGPTNSKGELNGYSIKDPNKMSPGVVKGVKDEQDNPQPKDDVTKATASLPVNSGLGVQIVSGSGSTVQTYPLQNGTPLDLDVCAGTSNVQLSLTPGNSNYTYTLARSNSAAGDAYVAALSGSRSPTGNTELSLSISNLPQGAWNKVTEAMTLRVMGTGASDCTYEMPVNLTIHNVPVLKDLAGGNSVSACLGGGKEVIMELDGDAYKIDKNETYEFSYGTNPAFTTGRTDALAPGRFSCFATGQAKSETVSVSVTSYAKVGDSGKRELCPSQAKTITVRPLPIPKVGSLVATKDVYCNEDEGITGLKFKAKWDGPSYGLPTGGSVTYHYTVAGEDEVESGEYTSLDAYDLPKSFGKSDAVPGKIEASVWASDSEGCGYKWENGKQTTKRAENNVPVTKTVTVNAPLTVGLAASAISVCPGEVNAEVGLTVADGDSRSYSVSLEPEGDAHGVSGASASGVTHTSNSKLTFGGTNGVAAADGNQTVTYSLTARDGGGCTDTKSNALTMTLLAPPALKATVKKGEDKLSPDDEGKYEVCAGVTLTLDVGVEGLTYVWKKDGTAIVGATGQTYDWTPTAEDAKGTGEVTLTCEVTSGSCPAVEETFDVKVNTAPVVTVNDGVVCSSVDGPQGDVKLTAEVEGSTNYSCTWKQGTTTVTLAINDPQTVIHVTPTSTETEYKVTVEDNDTHCKDEKPAKVKVRTNPTGNFSAPSKVCGQWTWQDVSDNNPDAPDATHKEKVYDTEVALTYTLENSSEYSDNLPSQTASDWKLSSGGTTFSPTSVEVSGDVYTLKFNSAVTGARSVSLVSFKTAGGCTVTGGDEVSVEVVASPAAPEVTVKSGNEELSSALSLCYGDSKTLTLRGGKGTYYYIGRSAPDLTFSSIGGQFVPSIEAEAEEGRTSATMRIIKSTYDATPMKDDPNSKDTPPKQMVDLDPAAYAINKLYEGANYIYAYKYEKVGDEACVSEPAVFPVTINPLPADFGAKLKDDKSDICWGENPTIEITLPSNAKKNDEGKVTEEFTYNFTQVDPKTYGASTELEKLTEGEIEGELMGTFKPSGGGKEFQNYNVKVTNEGTKCSKTFQNAYKVDIRPQLQVTGEVVYKDAGGTAKTDKIFCQGEGGTAELQIKISQGGLGADASTFTPSLSAKTNENPSVETTSNWTLGTKPAGDEYVASYRRTISASKTDSRSGWQKGEELTFAVTDERGCTATAPSNESLVKNVDVRTTPDNPEIEIKLAVDKYPAAEGGQIRKKDWICQGDSRGFSVNVSNYDNAHNGYTWQLFYNAQGNVPEDNTDDIAYGSVVIGERSKIGVCENVGGTNLNVNDDRFALDKLGDDGETKKYLTEGLIKGIFYVRAYQDDCPSKKPSKGGKIEYHENPTRSITAESGLSEVTPTGATEATNMACEGVEVQLSTTAFSTSKPLTPKYKWKVGNDNVCAESTYTYTPTSSGDVTLSLTVADEHACESKAVEYKYRVQPKPIFTVALNPEWLCSGAEQPVELIVTDKRTTEQQNAKGAAQYDFSDVTFTSNSGGDNRTPGSSGTQMTTGEGANQTPVLGSYKYTIPKGTGWTLPTLWQVKMHLKSDFNSCVSDNVESAVLPIVPGVNAPSVFYTAADGTQVTSIDYCTDGEGSYVLTASNNSTDETAATYNPLKDIDPNKTPTAANPKGEYDVDYEYHWWNDDAELIAHKDSELDLVVGKFKYSISGSDKSVLTVTPLKGTAVQNEFAIKATVKRLTYPDGERSDGCESGESEAVTFHRRPIPAAPKIDDVSNQFYCLPDDVDPTKHSQTNPIKSATIKYKPSGVDEGKSGSSYQPADLNSELSEFKWYDQKGDVINFGEGDENVADSHLSDTRYVGGAYSPFTYTPSATATENVHVYGVEVSSYGCRSEASKVTTITLSKNPHLDYDGEVPVSDLCKGESLNFKLKLTDPDDETVVHDDASYWDNVFWAGSAYEKKNGTVTEKSCGVSAEWIKAVGDDDKVTEVQYSQPSLGESIDDNMGTTTAVEKRIFSYTLKAKYGDKNNSCPSNELKFDVTVHVPPTSLQGTNDRVVCDGVEGYEVLVNQIAGHNGGAEVLKAHFYAGMPNSPQYEIKTVVRTEDSSGSIKSISTTKETTTTVPEKNAETITKANDDGTTTITTITRYLKPDASKEQKEGGSDCSVVLSGNAKVTGNSYTYAYKGALSPSDRPLYYQLSSTDGGTVCKSEPQFIDVEMISVPRNLVAYSEDKNEQRYNAKELLEELFYCEDTEDFTVKVGQHPGDLNQDLKEDARDFYTTDDEGNLVKKKSSEYTIGPVPTLDDLQRVDYMTGKPITDLNGEAQKNNYRVTYSWGYAIPDDQGNYTYDTDGKLIYGDVDPSGFDSRTGVLSQTPQTNKTGHYKLTARFEVVDPASDPNSDNPNMLSGSCSSSAEVLINVRSRPNPAIKLLGYALPNDQYQDAYLFCSNGDVRAIALRDLTTKYEMVDGKLKEVLDKYLDGDYIDYNWRFDPEATPPLGDGEKTSETEDDGFGTSMPIYKFPLSGNTLTGWIAEYAKDDKGDVIKKEVNGEEIPVVDYLKSQLILSVTDEYQCESYETDHEVDVYAPPVINRVYGTEACGDEPFKITVDQDRYYHKYELLLLDSEGKDINKVYGDDGKVKGDASPQLYTTTVVNGVPMIETTSAFGDSHIKKQVGDKWKPTKYKLVVHDLESDCSTEQEIDFRRYSLRPEIRFDAEKGKEGDAYYYCEGENVGYYVKVTDANGDVNLDGNGNPDFVSRLENIRYEVEFSEDGGDWTTGSVLRTGEKMDRKWKDETGAEHTDAGVMADSCAMSFLPQVPKGKDPTSYFDPSDESLTNSQTYHPTLTAGATKYKVRLKVKYEFAGDAAAGVEHKCETEQVVEQFVIMPKPELTVSNMGPMCQSDMKGVEYEVTNDGDIVKDGDGTDGAVKTEYHFYIGGKPVVAVNGGNYLSPKLKLDDYHFTIGEEVYEADADGKDVFKGYKPVEEAREDLILRDQYGLPELDQYGQEQVVKEGDKVMRAYAPLEVKDGQRVTVKVNMNYQSEHVCEAESAPVTFYNNFAGEVTVDAQDQCRGGDIEFHLSSVDPEVRYPDVNAANLSIKAYKLHVLEEDRKTPILDKDEANPEFEPTNPKDPQSPVDPTKVKGTFQYSGSSRTIHYWLEVQDENGCWHRVPKSGVEDVNINLFSITDIVVSGSTAKLDENKKPIFEIIEPTNGNDLCAGMEYTYTININVPGDLSVPGAPDVVPFDDNIDDRKTKDDGTPNENYGKPLKDVGALNGRYLFALGYEDHKDDGTVADEVLKLNENSVNIAKDEYNTVTWITDPSASTSNSVSFTHPKMDNVVFVARVKDIETGCEIIYRPGQRRVDDLDAEGHQQHDVDGNLLTKVEDPAYLAYEEPFKFHASPIPDAQVTAPSGGPVVDIKGDGTQMGYDVCYENNPTFTVMGPNVWLQRREDGAAAADEWTYIAYLKSDGTKAISEDLSDHLKSIFVADSIEVEWLGDATASTEVTDPNVIPETYTAAKAEVTLHLGLEPDDGWQQYRFVVDDGTCVVSSEVFYLHKRQAIYPFAPEIKKDANGEVVKELDGSPKIINALKPIIKNDPTANEDHYPARPLEKFGDWETTICEGNSITISASTMETAYPGGYYFELYDLNEYNSRPDAPIDPDDPDDPYNKVTPLQTAGGPGFGATEITVTSTHDDLHPKRVLLIYADFGSPRNHDNRACPKKVYIDIVPTPEPKIDLMGSLDKDNVDAMVSITDGLKTYGHDPKNFHWSYMRCDNTGKTELHFKDLFDEKRNVKDGNITIKEIRRNGDPMTEKAIKEELEIPLSRVEGVDLANEYRHPAKLKYVGNFPEDATKLDNGKNVQNPVPHEATRYDFDIEFGLADCPKMGYLTIIVPRTPAFTFVKPDNIVLTGRDVEIKVKVAGSSAPEGTDIEALHYTTYQYSIDEGKSYTDTIDATGALLGQSYTYVGGIPDVPADKKLHYCVKATNRWGCVFSDCKDRPVREDVKEIKVDALNGEDASLNTKEAVYCEGSSDVDIKLEKPQVGVTYYVLNHPEIAPHLVTQEDLDPLDDSYTFAGKFVVNQIEAKNQVESVTVRGCYPDMFLDWEDEKKRAAMCPDYESMTTAERLWFKLGKLPKDYYVDMAPVRVEEVPLPDAGASLQSDYIYKCDFNSKEITETILEAKAGTSYFLVYSKEALWKDPKKPDGEKEIDLKALAALANNPSAVLTKNGIANDAPTNTVTERVPIIGVDGDKEFKFIDILRGNGGVQNGYYYLIARNTSTLYTEHQAASDQVAAGGGDATWDKGTLLCPVALEGMIQVNIPTTEQQKVETTLTSPVICEKDPDSFAIYMSQTDYRYAGKYNGIDVPEEGYEYYLYCNDVLVPSDKVDGGNPQKSKKGTPKGARLDFEVLPAFYSEMRKDSKNDPAKGSKFTVKCVFSEGCEQWMANPVYVRAKPEPTQYGATISPEGGLLCSTEATLTEDQSSGVTVTLAGQEEGVKYSIIKYTDANKAAYDVIGDPVVGNDTGKAFDLVDSDHKLTVDGDYAIMINHVDITDRPNTCNIIYSSFSVKHLPSTWNPEANITNGRKSEDFKKTVVCVGGTATITLTKPDVPAANADYTVEYEFYYRPTGTTGAADVKIGGVKGPSLDPDKQQITFTDVSIETLVSTLPNQGLREWYDIYVKAIRTTTENGHKVSCEYVFDDADQIVKIKYYPTPETSGLTVQKPQKGSCDGNTILVVKAPDYPEVTYKLYRLTGQGGAVEKDWVPIEINVEQAKTEHPTDWQTYIKFTGLMDYEAYYRVEADNGACATVQGEVLVSNDNVPKTQKLDINRLICEGDAGTTAKMFDTEKNVKYWLHYMSYDEYNALPQEEKSNLQTWLNGKGVEISSMQDMCMADHQKVTFTDINYQDPSVPISNLISQEGIYYIVAQKYENDGVTEWGCKVVMGMTDFQMLRLPVSFVLDRSQFFCSASGVTVSLRGSESAKPDGSEETWYRLFKVDEETGGKTQEGTDIIGNGLKLEFPGVAAGLQNDETGHYTAMALKYYTLDQGEHTCTSTMEGTIELTKAEAVQVPKPETWKINDCGAGAELRILTSHISPAAHDVSIYVVPSGTTLEEATDLTPLPWMPDGIGKEKPDDIKTGIHFEDLPTGTSDIWASYEGNFDCAALVGTVTVTRYKPFPATKFDETICGGDEVPISDEYIMDGAFYYIEDEADQEVAKKNAVQMATPFRDVRDSEGKQGGTYIVYADYGPETCRTEIGTFTQYDFIEPGSFAGDPDVRYICSGDTEDFNIVGAPRDHSDVLRDKAMYYLVPVDAENPDYENLDPLAGNGVYRVTYAAETMQPEEVKFSNVAPGTYAFVMAYENHMCEKMLGTVVMKKSAIEPLEPTAMRNCADIVELKTTTSNEGVSYQVYRRYVDKSDVLKEELVGGASNEKPQIGTLDNADGITWPDLIYNQDLDKRPTTEWIVKATQGECQDVTVAVVVPYSLRPDEAWLSDVEALQAAEFKALPGSYCDGGAQKFTLESSNPDVPSSIPDVHYYLTDNDGMVPGSERIGDGAELEWTVSDTGSKRYVLHAYRDKEENCSYEGWDVQEVNFDGAVKPDLELIVKIDGKRYNLDDIPTLCPTADVEVKAKLSGKGSANIKDHIFNVSNDGGDFDDKHKKDDPTYRVDLTEAAETVDLKVSIVTSGDCRFDYPEQALHLRVDNQLKDEEHLIAMPERMYCPGEIGVKLAYVHSAEPGELYRLFRIPELGEKDEHGEDMLYDELMDIQEVPYKMQDGVRPQNMPDPVAQDTLYFAGWGYGGSSDVYASQGTYYVEVETKEGCPQYTNHLVVEQYPEVCKPADSLYVASVENSVIDLNSVNGEYGVIGMNILYHLSEPDPDIEYFLVKSDTILIGQNGPLAKFVSYDKPKNNKLGYWDGEYATKGWSMDDALPTPTGLELNFGPIGNLGKRTIKRDGKDDYEYFMEMRLDTIGTGDGVYCLYAFNRASGCECNVCEVIIGGEPLIAYDVEIYMSAKNNSQTVQLIPSYPNKSNHQYIGWSSMLDRVYLPIITTDPQGYWINAGSSDLNYDRSTGYVSKPGKYDSRTGRYLGKSDESNVWFELLQPDKETGAIPGHPELETKKIFGSYGLLNPDFTSEASADRIVNDEPLPTGFFWYQKLPSFFGQEVFYYRLENKQMPGRYSNIAKITVLCGNADTGDDQSMFLIPNAFSPNGDGLNDVFKIIIPDKYQANSESKLQVFNRWGTLVYRSQGLRYGEDEQWWDGKSTTSNMVTLGEDLPSGTYYYVFTITFIDKANATKSERKMNGYIELRR